MSGTVHVENGPIGRTLLRFALPVLATQVLQELYNVADCAVVGRFGEPGALAATGVAGLVLSVLINFFVGFSSGISVVTAKLFGQYDYDRLQRTMNSVFRLVLVAGLCLSVLGVVLAGQALRWLNCPEEVWHLARTYLRVCACGLVFQLLYNVAAAVLRSLGDTKSPLLYFFFSCLCNLGLDALLVIVLHMGVLGAALATLASQVLLGVLLLVRLHRLSDECRVRLTGKGLSLRDLLSILRIGIPAGMQALFMSISSLLIQTQINSFGPDAIAGMTLYAKLEGCLYLPAFAYGIALTGFVGQNVGAGRVDRVRQSVRISLGLCWAVILPLSLLITFLSPILLRFFTTEPGILENAHQAILWNLPVYVFYAMNQVFLGAIKGYGKTTWPMICTLLCYALFRVVWCRLLIPVYGTMVIVYLSYDVSFLLMLALLLPVYLRLVRGKNRLAAPAGATSWSV